MAHEIDQTTMDRGSAMFAYTPAWHGLGTVVDSAQTTADALRIAGLDWDVRVTELSADFGDGRYAKVPSHRATYREDTMAPLGCVGMRYEPLQNRDAFGWMDDIVGESKAIWHTCGSLRGGRKVWMLAKLPGSLEITNGDYIDKYTLILNSHDGTGAVLFFPTNVRVVCMNTARLAVSQYLRAERDGGLALGLRLFHTAGSLEHRVQKAKQLLGVVDRSHEDFAVTARSMAATPLNSEQVGDYFASLVVGRSDRNQDRVVSSLWDRFHLPTNEGGYGASVWTAYNAASEYADHELRVTGAGVVRAERRFRSTLFGSAHAFKDRAWQAAVQLTA